jgi:transposase-like protein
MKSCRPPLFWKRKFEPHVIVTCVRWYCRFALSLRDLEELMAERGLSVDHTTIWRWVQTYGPEVCRRLQGEVKRKSSTWHMDETFVRIAGKWMYLFRAVDSHGQTVDFYLWETQDREAAKLFLKKALANADNRPPHVFARDGLRSYPAALRELQAEGEVARHCRQRTRLYGNNRIESDQGPRTTSRPPCQANISLACHLLTRFRKKYPAESPEQRWGRIYAVAIRDFATMPTCACAMAATP